MIALKYLAYGTSVNVFRDYFQVGEPTAMKCEKLLTREITPSPFCKIAPFCKIVLPWHDTF
jgi:hypothetical protein